MISAELSENYSELTNVSACGQNYILFVRIKTLKKFFRKIGFHEGFPISRNKLFPSSCRNIGSVVQTTFMNPEENLQTITY